MGENAPAVRGAAAAGLRFLGLEIDPALNAKPSGDADVSIAGVSVRTLVIRAHEDVEVARDVRQMLAAEVGTGDIDG